MRERESMFNDFVSDLRRKEKDERSTQRERAKSAFLELLKEQNLERNSKWSEVKEKIRDDNRYRDFESSSQREDVFRSFVATLLSKVADDNEREEDVKERERKEREEASLRERKRTVEAQLQTSMRERDKEHERHKHAECVEHCKALLTDLIRSADTSWRDAKKTLKRDHRWDSVASLNREEREVLFNEHIKKLEKKKKQSYYEMLEEIKVIIVKLVWSLHVIYKSDEFRISS